MAWILYYLSLVPLFGYLAIKYYDNKIFSFLLEYKFDQISYGQYSFLISILALILSIIIIFILKHISRSRFDLSGAKISSKPQNINHELIGVLSAVVLPFLTVNFDSGRDSLASLFILIIIGLITTQSTIYYRNPLLAILKFKIYQLEIEHKSFSEHKVVYVISLHLLNEADSLYLKEIGNNVYFAKRTN
ncbi:MAG: hypothetical protein HND40_15940 [Ignavibacteriota bacterium]|nr:hypothetical protein [Ignavibacteriota bacterium]MCO6448903.1 hypothetical protein [Ignavibacterium album]MCZ2267847.1 hypothetical protein [Ignavibacteriales bacterium]QKK00951.1 MAG: hypothetical protein HND40_15940 [Ignavibacteriota bacterium]HOJ07769.1 hypothetical protein [Ignavibacteriaceae bacterium]